MISRVLYGPAELNTYRLATNSGLRCLSRIIKFNVPSKYSLVDVLWIDSIIERQYLDSTVVPANLSEWRLGEKPVSRSLASVAEGGASAMTQCLSPTDTSVED